MDIQRPYQTGQRTEKCTASLRVPLSRASPLEKRRLLLLSTEKILRLARLLLLLAYIYGFLDVFRREKSPSLSLSCRPVLTAAVPLLRFVLHVTVFRPYGTRILAATEEQRTTGKLPLKANHKRKKLTESLWKVTAYAILMSLGMFALHDQEWTFCTTKWWEGYPHQLLPSKVDLYYHGELAFYGSSMFMLLVWEERRHDFLVMLAHHLVTIFLIGFSYHAGFTRIGAIVMLLHDPSDVFLETAKICSYLGWENAATVFFALLLLSWLVLRLVVFPFWLIRSTLFDLTLVLGEYPPYSWVLIAMLCMLVSMHVYWFGLIARIAWLKITTGDARDTREDDD